MQYLVFPKSLCLAMFSGELSNPTLEPLEDLPLAKALDRGYRWIRTEGHVAIFELDEIVAEGTEAPARKFHHFKYGPTIDLNEVVGYQYNDPEIRVVMKGGAEFRVANDKDAHKVLDEALLRKNKRNARSTDE